MRYHPSYSIAPILALALTNVAQAADSPSCQNFKLADIGWTDNVVNNALTSVVVQGLGYKVSKTTVSAPIALTGLKSGQLDAFLDYWSPALDSVVEPLKGEVRVLPEPNMKGAKYSLAVPKYLYDAGLKDFSDIARFKEALQGQILGIEAGSGGNKLISDIIEKNQFGLGDFKLLASSESAMLAQVKKLTAKKAPVVFLGWSPHPMNIHVDMAYLTGGEKHFGADTLVYSIVSQKFASTCPNLNKLVSQLRFTPLMESVLMEKVMNKEDPLQAAKAYLQANPEVWPAWVAGVTTLDGKSGVDAVKRALAK